ncbi:hypothetical protein PILCRDRAFT_594513 [Piloderma croceum F 1598]|uniref:Uncharacterized protein n=1 Tax=Piloderma croceum (strain F 1598) TaxID=765440 RepID=A0A0C3F0G6_PILCF|nr:hypothetical protein PILCRDRAFT_594513 [Piloderma croceum F 1598]
MFCPKMTASKYPLRHTLSLHMHTHFPRQPQTHCSPRQPFPTILTGRSLVENELLFQNWTATVGSTAGPRRN